MAGCFCSGRRVRDAHGEVISGVTGVQELQEFRSCRSQELQKSGVQESGVQESGVQESGVQESGVQEGMAAAEQYQGALFQRT